MFYVICYVICYMLHVICYILYVICYMLYAIYIYIYICMYVCTYVCMYVCMCVCMHACMYVNNNTYICRSARRSAPQGSGSRSREVCSWQHSFWISLSLYYIYIYIYIYITYKHICRYTIISAIPLLPTLPASVRSGRARRIQAWLLMCTQL